MNVYQVHAVDDVYTLTSDIYATLTSAMAAPGETLDWITDELEAEWEGMDSEGVRWTITEHELRP